MGYERIKTYYDLIASDYSELTEEDVNRKRFVEALPESVVTALAVRAAKIRDEVMRLEAERDTILDFLNGCCWQKFCPPFEYPTKDGDTD